VVALASRAVSLEAWQTFERRHIFLTGLRAFATSTLVLVVYFTVPIASKPRGSIAVRLVIGLILLIAMLAYEVRAIIRSGRPILRAADAMALVIPAFVVVFAWTYLTIGGSDPTAFTQPLDRITALYFTVTVFATVGFGDITPVTDPARVVVMAQMVCDLIFIAVVIRLILAAASGTLGAPGRAPADTSTPE
jgi:hypothetical protein